MAIAIHLPLPGLGVAVGGSPGDTAACRAACGAAWATAATGSGGGGGAAASMGGGAKAPANPPPPLPPRSRISSVGWGCGPLDWAMPVICSIEKSAEASPRAPMRFP